MCITDVFNQIHPLTTYSLSFYSLFSDFFKVRENRDLKKNVKEIYTNNESSQSENKLTRGQRKHDNKPSTRKLTLFKEWHEKEGAILCVCRICKLYDEV